MLKALLEVLDIDFAHLELGTPSDGYLHVACPAQPELSLEECKSLSWQDDDPLRQPIATAAASLNVAKVQVGLFVSLGVLVVGTRRPGFPDREDKVVLNVFANQVAVAMQGARALHHKTKEASQRHHGPRYTASALEVPDLDLTRRDLEFQLVVESIPVPVAVTNPKGEVEGVNRATIDYFGRTFEQLKAWKASELVHPEDLERTIAAQVAAHQAGRTYDIQSRHRRHDGVYRWFNVLGVPLRNPDGEILRWFHLIIDIDDQKRAEHALSESENYLTKIVNTIPGLTWVASVEGYAEYINQYYSEYMGMKVDEALGDGWVQAVHPEDLPQLLQRWATILKSGVAGEAEARLRKHDGSYRWFLFRTNPIRDESGKVIKWFGVNTDIEDRKLAEDSLRRSEANLRQMTETIPQMLWSATKDGAIDYCNQKLLDYTGFTASEVMDAGWVKFVHPSDVERSKSVWAESVATGCPYLIEVRTHHAADGLFRWLLTTAMPLRDADGKVQRWYGTCIDIHDRKEAEAAVERSAKGLSQIIDSIPVYVWSARADGGVEFVNRHYLKYLGMRQEEVQGWAILARTHPDDAQIHVTAWRTLLASKMSGEWQTRQRRSDGNYRWFLHRVNPFMEGSGSVKWFGVTIDIEELKQAEEQLRASELNLRRQTETIPQMIWSSRPDGLIDYCNAQLASFIGCSPEQVLGDFWKKCIHPEDLEHTTRIWKASVETGVPYRAEARFAHAASKSFRWCVTTGLPLRDEDGRIMKWYGACVDMHDWKMAQDELSLTQAELAHLTRVMTMGQLTASIAHELNQPLAGILMNASTGLRMLSAATPNVEGAAETARRTIRDANRASEVIARLRALFSKKARVSELVDLNAATQEIISLVSHEISRRGVQLFTSFDLMSPNFCGDRVQIQQVILNLIMNGIESMENISSRPKELFIRTETKEDSRVVLSVRDAGCGFDQLKVERLFSPFFTTKPSGMGIGLSVSRTIIENHNGVMNAKLNEEFGSVFSFSLPVNALPLIEVGA